jgi:hypothetical protein
VQHRNANARLSLGEAEPKKRNDQNKGARTSGVTFILVVQTAEPRGSTPLIGMWGIGRRFASCSREKGNNDPPRMAGPPKPHRQRRAAYATFAALS